MSLFDIVSIVAFYWPMSMIILILHVNFQQIFDQPIFLELLFALQTNMLNKVEIPLLGSCSHVLLVVTLTPYVAAQINGLLTFLK